jgi:hypothetical protein
MLGAGHSHAPRVIALLTAARDSIEAAGFLPFDTGAIGLEVVLYAPAEVDPWDATNYLGGIADVLEDKGRRGGTIDHIGELGSVSVYRNDRQIKQVAYSQRQGDDARYAVRIWQLPTGELGP